MKRTESELTLARQRVAELTLRRDRAAWKLETATRAYLNAVCNATDAVPEAVEWRLSEAKEMFEEAVHRLSLVEHLLAEGG